jgi:hypothetical protein
MLSSFSYQVLAIEAPEDYYNNQKNLELAQKEFKKGNYTEAVFALQRVLALTPSHKEAGILLARTYVKLKEYRAAQKQYDQVRPHLSAAERNHQDREVALMLRRSNYSFRSIVGFDVGYDDNLTSITTADSVFITSTSQNLILDNTELKKGAVLRLFGASTLRYQQHKDQWWRFDGIVSQRQDGSYNQQQLYGAAGFYQKIKGAQYEIKLGSSYGNGDGLDRKSDYHLTLGRQQKLAQGSWSSELKFNQRHYAEQAVRNDQRITGTLGYQRPLNDKWRGEIRVNLSNDLQSNDGRTDLDYNSQGLYLGFSRPIGDKLKFSLDAKHQHYQYRGEDPNFLRERRDNQTRLQSGLRYQYGKKSIASLRLEWLRNRSNIKLYQYKKKALTFSYTYRLE